MWLEVKAVITVMACFIIGVTFALSGSLILVILAMMGMGTMIFGDFLIGWKLISTDAIYILDPNGPNERTVDLHLIGGGRRFIKGKKTPLGKIEFVFQGKEASVIDTGVYPIRFPNGNQGVVAHESYDKDVSMAKIKFLEKASKELGVDDIKEMRKKILSRRPKK